MWDIEERRIVKEYQRKCYGYCYCSFVGHDREYLACADIGDISLWNRSTGAFVDKISAHSKKLIGIVVHPFDSGEFITYAYDGNFIVYGTMKMRMMVRRWDYGDRKRGKQARPAEEPADSEFKRVRLSHAEGSAPSAHGQVDADAVSALYARLRVRVHVVQTHESV
jgi:hypothetical protein